MKASLLPLQVCWECSHNTLDQCTTHHKPSHCTHSSSCRRVVHKCSLKSKLVEVESVQTTSTNSLLKCQHNGHLLQHNKAQTKCYHLVVQLSRIVQVREVGPHHSSHRILTQLMLLLLHTKCMTSSKKM